MVSASGNGKRDLSTGTNFGQRGVYYSVLVKRVDSGGRTQENLEIAVFLLCGKTKLNYLD